MAANLRIGFIVFSSVLLSVFAAPFHAVCAIFTFLGLLSSKAMTLSIIFPILPPWEREEASYSCEQWRMVCFVM